MNVELPDGTVIQDVPEGISRSQLAMRLSRNGMKVPAEWMASGVSGIPDTPQERPPAPPPSLPDKIRGGIETAMSLGSGLIGGGLGYLGGTLGGIAGSIASGKFGTLEGSNMAAQSAQEGARGLTYAPRTELGQQYLAKAAEGLSLLAAIGPMAERATLAANAPRAAQYVAALKPGEVLRDEAALVRGSLPRVDKALDALSEALSRDKPEMVGMGSAETRAATIRKERAAGLPVPIDLTKGQATRDFQQLRFERETAKLPAGEKLRKAAVDQNQKILSNFDAWAEMTGAESPDLRTIGQVVDKALVEKANAAKGRIKAAYQEAKAAGETAEPVPARPLLDYAEQHRAEAINAPIINSFETKLNSLVKDGQISLNDLEEVRKMVGNLSGKDATNAHFGKEIKGLIDGISENAGGDLYNRARSLRTQYAKEFENVGVIDKLLSAKPGTTDRAVAFEDVFKHSVLSGSLDDVRQVRKTLQTAGPNGGQAWKELQGQTVAYLKEQATKNAQRDAAGNPVVSFAGLDKAVKALDADGKLEVMFGKQGAQQIRDIRDLSADVMTVPLGAENYSNTGAILMDAIGALSHGRLPTATAKALAIVKHAYADYKTKQQVEQALRP